MRKIREILRLKHDAGLSYEGIAKSCSTSKSTVSETLRKFAESGLSWPLAKNITDEHLEAALYSQQTIKNNIKPPLDLPYIHSELRRKGVTLRLLWEEYKAVNPDGYQYSYFCEIYFKWRQKLEPTLRQTYPLGKYMEVDFAGQTVEIIDAETSEAKEAQIFVAVMSATNYTYVQAALSQDLYNWIDLHCKALTFFGGVPEIVVPDNLKSGVKKACRYEPEINPTYAELARHYNTAIVPARPRKAQDKSKVENAVLIVERWILARLRNMTFFSLEELNSYLNNLMERYNNKPFQKLDGCRKELFETTEKEHLKPLPSEPYEFARWKKATVNIDYHVEVDQAYYSCPYQLVKEKVDVRITTRVVEIFHKGKRVSSHPKCLRRGEFKTNADHLAPSHRKYLEWTPSRIIKWAEKNGTETAALVEKIMESRQHKEQAYRSCLGLLRLSNKYTPERLENACKRALIYHSISYKSVKSILEKGLDQVQSETEEPPILTHQNIRGANYYRGEEDVSPTNH